VSTSLGALHPYRICRGSDPAWLIARHLESSHVPFLVVSGASHDDWRVLEVTPSLLVQLAAAAHASVDEAVRWHAPPRSQWIAKRYLQFGASRSSQLIEMGLADSDGPRVVLDDDHHPVGVLADVQAAGLPAEEAELFPTLTPSARTVVPDDLIELELALELTAPLGAAAGLLLQFGPGETSVTLNASVSSTHFVPPDSESWQHDFVIERNPRRRPLRWTFRARASGDRTAYTLTVRFFRRGEVVGSAVITLARTPVRDEPAVPPATSGRLRALSVTPATVPVTLDIAELGGNARRISMYRNGALERSEIWVAAELTAYATGLEEASSLEAVQQLGVGLMADLPDAVQSFLDDPAQAGAATLIAAGAPLAPFEVLQLRAASNGPFLGVERPVARWTGTQVRNGADVRIGEVLCIRPAYSPPLPSAAQEEEDLRGRYAAAVTVIRTIDELQHALDTSSARLVHFAGHAEGNPAQLSLEGGPVRPQIFHPSTALMRAHPFMFLNGCRAGAGRPATPAAQANMVRFLLSAGAAGIVAPMVQTQSPAARLAARTFYDQIAANKTVAEAARAVRELAMTAPDGDVGTYLSYLAFTAPSLRLSTGP